jgi:hypothetical protein
MSVAFTLNSGIKHTDRTTYDLLDWMGDIGGVLETLLLAFRAIAFYFSFIKIKALVSNRLFRLSAKNKISIFGQVNLTEN